MNLARTHSRYLACSHPRFRRYRAGVGTAIVVIILYALGCSPEWIGCCVALAGLWWDMAVDRRFVASAGEAGADASAAC